MRMTRIRGSNLKTSYYESQLHIVDRSFDIIHEYKHNYYGTVH